MDAIHEAEQLARRVPDVTACRIETDPDGGVQAVHVTTRGSRPPSAVAQDVASVLAAATSILVAAERVHVVALAEPEPAADAALELLEFEGRMRFVAVHTSATMESSRVEVELALGAETALGHAEARGAGPAPELLAQACLDAVEKLCAARVSLRLVAVHRSTVGPVEVVSVVVQEADGREERLHVGASRIDGDLARATAYAALASLNRRLGRILAGPPKSYRIS